MKVFLLTICLVLISSFWARAQTGFFMMLSTKEDCSRLVKTLDFKQQYCVTEDPIISGAEFSVEGNLQYDLVHENQSFSIRFTKAGLETLTLICTRLPEKQLVLVVDGKAAGTYDNKNIKPTQIMPISGKADSKEINWVYDKLKNRN
jgi:hypothetical protein